MATVFVTTAGAGYPRAWVFPSLSRLSCRVVCLLDPADARPLPANCERHPYAGDRCYQDGRFLDAVPGLCDRDLVVLADADAVVQRDLLGSDFCGLDYGFGLGFNMHPGQRGWQEYGLLSPRRPLDEAARVLGLRPELLRQAPVYNTGLMAARPPAWRLLRRLYALAAGGHGPDLFEYPAWQQYLVCLTLAGAGLPVRELGYDTHSHAHFGLTPGHEVGDGRLYFEGRLVFFAHAIPGLR